VTPGEVARNQEQTKMEEKGNYISGINMDQNMQSCIEEPRLSVSVHVLEVVQVP
jgi:hypothetical protein